MLAGPILQQYFTNYLIAQRRLSPQTLASYRDTFRLLLQFVQSELKIEPAQLALEQLDAEIILRFLDNLELQRKNSVVSRNLRCINLVVYIGRLQGRRYVEDVFRMQGSDWASSTSASSQINHSRAVGTNERTGH